MSRYNTVSFLTVLVVWSTTPFFITKASINSAPIFAASARMLLATIICLGILLLLKQKLNIKPFWKKYFYAGIGIFITLSLVYISARHTPSGLIAIIFALTPIATGFFAKFMQVDNFNLVQIISSIIGFIGMVIIFFDNQLAEVFYLSLLLFAMVFQAYISVKIKQLQIKATSLQTTTGGLLFSLPFFIISFLVFETNIPSFNNEFIFATIYLAIFGSIFGFIAYYYLIDNARIFLVAVIPMITPIFALLLGVYFNNEIITNFDYLGSLIVLISVIYYEFYRKKP